MPMSLVWHCYNELTMIGKSIGIQSYVSGFYSPKSQSNFFRVVIKRIERRIADKVICSRVGRVSSFPLLVSIFGSLSTQMQHERQSELTESQTPSHLLHHLYKSHPQYRGEQKAASYDGIHGIQECPK